MGQGRRRGLVLFTFRYPTFLVLEDDVPSPDDGKQALHQLIQAMLAGSLARRTKHEVHVAVVELSVRDTEAFTSWASKLAVCSKREAVEVVADEASDVREVVRHQANGRVNQDVDEGFQLVRDGDRLVLMGENVPGHEVPRSLMCV